MQRPSYPAVLKGIFGALLVFCLSLALVACGGSGETKSTEDTVAAAEVRALELEKEQAEAEAETARLDAQKEQRQAEAARRQAKEEKKEREAEEAQPEPEPEPEPESEEASQPPNVLGLPLSTAEQLLSAAGFTAAPVNTDTLFGIVDPDNYTICTQSPPRGTVVKVLAQKYGC